MKVIEVTPRGYCKGVVNALNIVKATVEQYPNTPITILGMIVHNKHVVASLEEMGVKTIDHPNKTRLELLDEIKEGVVIFSAHGITEEVKQKAMHKGLIVVDGSCSDVVKTQEYVKTYLEKGYEIFYIGKHNHPEAEAVISIDPIHIHLIQVKEDLSKIKAIQNPILITNQTTMSLLDVIDLINVIQKEYPQAIILEEICNATRIRQEAVLQLNPNDIDALFIVGDIRSNNTNNLASIAKQHGIAVVYRIETIDDINKDELHLFNTVAVTSGASTPTHLTNEVIEYLKKYK